MTVISLFGSGSLDSATGGGGGGVGSGFVLNGDGEIATNAHVVTQGNGSDAQKAREVYVEFADGNRVEAKIVGQDPNADVALLKIDPKGLTLRPLPLGSSASVAVGEPVAAIGSPFGERQSLSVGVVSAIDRDIQSLNGEFAIPGAFQTDAAINPGNSGGPLVDGDGKVIGINQQIKTNSGGGEGVGFAVPVDVIKRSLGAAARDRQRPLRVPRRLLRAAVPAARATASTSTSRRARGSRRSSPARPADKAGHPRRRAATRVPDPELRPGRRHHHEGRAASRSRTPTTSPRSWRSSSRARTSTVEVHRGGETKEIKVKLGRAPAVGAERRRIGSG